VKPGPGDSAPPPAPRPAADRAAKPDSSPRPVATRPPPPGLPLIGSPAELAAHLATTPEKLKWLTLEVGKHYATFRIPKAHGERTIEAPKKKLRAAQRWIHRRILSAVPAADAAHGFIKGRSPRTNALPHVGKVLVLKLDLRDFFWQVNLKRVRGLFQSLGYSREVSAVLWRLCCHKGRLPQGAPSSPAITNLCCRRLDARLAGLARAMEGVFTRYADDLTFSFAKGRKPVGEFLSQVRVILREEGFQPASEKTRVLRASARQSVTGLTVNRKLSPPRREVRALRALLHEARTKGTSIANRQHEKAFAAHVRGRIEAVRAIDRAKGEKLLSAYRAISW
jgi:RNA-directed DNA polymerase